MERGLGRTSKKELDLAGNSRLNHPDSEEFIAAECFHALGKTIRKKSKDGNASLTGTKGHKARPEVLGRSNRKKTYGIASRAGDSTQ